MFCTGQTAIPVYWTNWDTTVLDKLGHQCTGQTGTPVYWTNWDTHTAQHHSVKHTSHTHTHTLLSITAWSTPHTHTHTAQHHSVTVLVCLLPRLPYV